MIDYFLGDNPKLIGYWPLNDEAESPKGLITPKYGIAYVNDGGPIRLDYVSHNKDEWYRINVVYMGYPWAHTEG